MTKIAARVLGLALLATPLCGFADATGRTGQVAVKDGPQERSSPTTCGTTSGTLQYTGVVVGIGGNWWGTNAITFTIQTPDNNLHTEKTANLYSDPAGRQMLSLLMASQFAVTPILLNCYQGLVNGVLLGGLPSAQSVGEASQQAGSR